jgi:hypothetical protein
MSAILNLYGLIYIITATKDDAIEICFLDEYDFVADTRGFRTVWETRLGIGIADGDRCIDTLVILKAKRCQVSTNRGILV